MFSGTGWKMCLVVLGFFSCLDLWGLTEADRYFNTLGLYFDDIRIIDGKRDNLEIDTGVLVAALPQIKSGYVREGSAGTPPLQGIPNVSLTSRVFANSGYLVWLELWLGWMSLREDIFGKADSFKFSHQSGGLSVQFGRQIGQWQLAVPFSYQTAASNTVGNLIDPAFESSLSFVGRTKGVGIVATSPIFFAGGGVHWRDSLTSLNFSETSEVKETSSLQEPSRYQRIYQLAAGIRVGKSLKISFSELLSPGAFAVPRVAILHSTVL